MAPSARMMRAIQLVTFNLSLALACAGYEASEGGPSPCNCVSGRGLHFQLQPLWRVRHYRQGI